MFKNYLKIALRNLRRYKVYSFINISGLVVGMACFILIILYVQSELSFDRYHENSSLIYRVTTEGSLSGKNMNVAKSPAPLGPALVNEFPDVQNTVRFLNPYSSRLIKYNEKKFYENRFFYADNSVFEIFTFPLLKGDSMTALKDPFSLVITEDVAEKYFGREEPLGKVINVNSRTDYKITGVLKNIPRNSHFRFDFLASFETLVAEDENLSTNWANVSYFTYVLLGKGHSASEFADKLPLVVEKYVVEYLRPYLGDDDQVASMFKFHIQPLTRIHLHSKLLGEIEANSDITYVYIFSAIAFFILILACINFMNLSTAHSSLRAKEIGIRKVIGAQRIQVIRQFLGETFLLSFISLVFAICLVHIVLPAFNAFAGSEINLKLPGGWTILIFILGSLVVAGLFSGIYPAFFLSGLKPEEILKGRLGSEASVPLLRKILVIFQFSISIALIIGTILIHDQLIFIRNRNLGFNKDQLLCIQIRNFDMRRNYEVVKNEILQQSNVKSITASSGLPGKGLKVTAFLPERAAKDERLFMYVISSDYDFIRTLEIEIIDGRDFSREFTRDKDDSFIINEAAALKLGWESPVGKEIEPLGLNKGRIIGVVKNFHFNSLHEKIDPLVLMIRPEEFSFFAVRISPQNISHTVAFLEDKWHKLDPALPFEYSFLDEDFEKLYKADKKLEKIFLHFTILAIFVACLGLFGLASFTAEQRTKEIGIRKVLGASTLDIMTLLTKELAKWVMIANVIAWPIAYYVMNSWLRNFAYRVSMELWMFFLAGCVALATTIITVSYQTVRSALSDPSEALRNE